MIFFQHEVHQSSGEVQWVVLRTEYWSVNWKTEHWTTKQQFEVAFDSLICFSNTSTAHFGSVSQMFASHTDMASSASGFALIFKLSEYQHTPDQLGHSFFTFITCLWTFETLISVRSTKSSGNKQRKLCFSVTKAEIRSTTICKQYLVKKNEKVVNLSLLTLNFKL